MNYFENHTFDENLPLIFHVDRLFSPAKIKCISNWHDNIELIYCVEGEGLAVIEGVPVPLAQDNLLIINSGDIHYITSDTHMVYNCLIIDSSFLLEQGIDVSQVFFTSNITDERAAVFFKLLITELEEQNDYYQSLLKGEILAFMAYLCRHYSHIGEHTVHNDRIKNILIYIREHFTEEINVDTIASHAGFSRYHFSRQFKQSTGMTVMEYVRFLRCRRAKELLQDGWSAGKVSAACGFSDVSYFTKVFKKHFGVLPSGIRSGSV